MRNPIARSNRAAPVETAVGAAASGRGLGSAVLRWLGWSYRDLVGCVLGVAVTGAILVNGLFLQSGPHPAPMFNGGSTPIAEAATKDLAVGGLPRPRASAPVKSDPASLKPEPAKAEPVKTEPTPAPRPAVEIITDIQRELARRGFYEGGIDGVYGSRTDAAVRDFEQAAGLKPSSEPSAALLRTIARSNVKAAKATTVGTSNGRNAEAPAPSKRVMAMQRALAEYGYGQLRPSGLIDRETRTAIEKFERDRKLPVTGQVSDRIARELAAITGRPLE